VVKAWGRLADECNCSINLVHHVRKGNGQEANADSVPRRQGARRRGALVQVFNRMTPDEASLAGIAEDQRGFYFRVQNDKANLAPPDKASWYRMNNVSLDNGDQVGVACPWKWPELFEGMSTRHSDRSPESR
jgi:RecA-family ATPase